MVGCENEKYLGEEDRFFVSRRLVIHCQVFYKRQVRAGPASWRGPSRGFQAKVENPGEKKLDSENYLIDTGSSR